MAASILNVAGDNLAYENSAANNNNNHNNNNNNNHVVNNNNNNNNFGKSTQNLCNMKEKRNTLEQRKQHLEKLLLEKKWLLQQIQKEETHILQGNYNYLHFNDIFTHLSQQYKLTQQQQQQQQQQENFQLTENDFKMSVNNNNNTAILRHKSTCSMITEDNLLKQQMNYKMRLPEGSNRSSEYDNYPCIRILDGDDEAKLLSKTNKASNTNLAASSNMSSLNKKLNTTTTSQFDNSTPATILNFAASPRQMPRQSHAERHKFNQLPLQPQRTHQPHAAETISLYSINSSNVATLRHQHIAPQQQPIIIQYEKYCLSPTRQTFNEGSFIKSSQEIKRFIPSPLQQQAQLSIKPQTNKQIINYQQTPAYVQFQPLDNISLAPSYMSVNSNLPDAVEIAATATNWKRTHAATADGSSLIKTCSNKQLDDISICSTNSENMKRGLKPKVWLESSLDGPLLLSDLLHD